MAKCAEPIRIEYWNWLRRHRYYLFNGSVRVHVDLEENALKSNSTNEQTGGRLRLTTAALAIQS